MQKLVIKVRCFMENLILYGFGLLMVFMFARHGLAFGSKWEFGGPYGMPHSLVAADGWHYQNGEEIDPVTLTVIRSGKEEEVWLFLLCVLVGIIGWVVVREILWRRREKRGNNHEHRT